MPSFFRNKRLIVLLVSIILLVALIGFSLRERENISLPEQFVKDIVGFGQNIASKPASFVQGGIESVQDLLNTYSENKKLKSRLEELALLETQVTDLERDNEELRAQTNVEGNIRDYNTTNATVIARNPDQWQDTIIIDKGQVNGIEADMAVQTAGGMIGRVKDTGQFTSTVELLSARNSNNRVSALIQTEESNVYGLVEGFDPEREELMVKKIPFDVEVEEGSSVITSGLGGVFPRGLLIGEVTEVSSDEYGLTQTAYVKPAAKLYDIEHVLVLERIAAGADEIEAESEEEEE
ncbi:rod shape-determining protein MreC [Jeotgalibacillus haloalkalitolerans]|uniref:Cell shape-determining protein MreC n=1 Tax=Jeotgalibacillus haloalkalitolerans TaxID=3104292 RepID=A0ABU5KM63_9BACL|nr:rod shape-determining protein MreC [Jeotgalibacillus sp. HH7-29]MDZ5712357.1 rod shape-determining protein MreC [Jeotgalibacillus sp. HH7-29]